ncbi:MAG: multi-sensor signal transduction histidine kinase [Variovorax sp.]|nr:multi-sensor signal transduction histidine kinase [Variovorax sp.]
MTNAFIPQPWADQPYSVKRHGLTVTNCDAEPVRTPGCIQAHGALLVLRLSDLTVLQASENSHAILGQAPDRLLGRACMDIVGVEGEARLRELLAKEPTDRNPLYLLTLPCLTGAGESLDVTAHTVDGVVILEFESTGRKDSAQPDYYSLVKTTVARLQTAATMQQFCDVVTQEIQQLTGQDRVMVYKFHADGHGEVVAESKRADLDPWLGLHYPAEDIPKPARDVFTKTWLRPVPDVSDALAELVPLVNPDTGLPLDMTYCALRGVSIMYTEYLRNMGVAAALTMAIRRDDALWGLIACHHYSGPRRVPYQVRAACEFLSQVVSLQHQAASDREHTAYRLAIDDTHRQLLDVAISEGGLACLTDGARTLLDGIRAGGSALYYLDRWWCTGATPEEVQLDALADWLMTAQFADVARPVYATDRLAQSYPPAAAFADVASGLLALPIAISERSLMLWFRPETLQTVKWGGNPADKPTVPGPHGPRLTPRRSFELFTESVRQRALPWIPAEIEAASVLRLRVIELVVGRSERRAVQATDLMRSNEELDAFAYVASHDLKEPLRGITQYAHQLLADSTDTDSSGRSKLDGLVRLTSRMDSLLDSLLHFSRVGGDELSLEIVDVDDVLSEAVEIVGFRTSDTQEVEVVVARPLPAARCNRVRCRQVLVNLLSNALKYNDKAVRRIEIGYIGPDETGPRPGCPERSLGATIYFVADNGIGIQAHHFKQIFKLFKRLHGREAYGGGAGAGLTIVRKLVEQHGGQVWVDSAAGQGSTFYFTLPDTQQLIATA